MGYSTAVPFLDLITPHCDLHHELLDVVRVGLQSGSFVGGRMVTGFEEAFAGFCDARLCVGVGSGTDALRFAIMAAGIGAGDAVITVPNSFIATTEAISQAGAMPEFVDIDERTYNMDPERLRDYLEHRCVRAGAGAELKSLRTGRRVAAILPVHLYGQMADMDPILELADEFGLTVIEDACQSHGAQYYSRKNNRWYKAGTMGRATAFSFYPGKNLGACGEAGAITTNDDGLASRARVLRDHGQARKYYHDCEGYNGRLDALQAGFLAVKLEHLSKWNMQRRLAAERYSASFAAYGEDVVLPFEPSWSQAVYHLYVIRTAERDHLRDALRESGIETGIHYPIPLHLQKAYRQLNYKPGDFPAAETVAGEILSLPMFPNLRADQQSFVVSTIHRLATSSGISNKYCPSEATQK